MVTPINPTGNQATEVAAPPLVAAKPQSVREKARPARGVETESPALEKQAGAPSAGEVDSAIENVSAQLKQSGSELEIQYDKTSGRNVIKIVDSGTGGVVLQIPSEEVLAMARKFRESSNTQDAAGLFVDQEG